MKNIKLLCIILVSAMTLTLFACTPEGETSNTSNTISETSSESSTDTSSPDESSQSEIGLSNTTIDLMKGISMAAPTGKSISNEFINATAEFTFDLFKAGLNEEKNSLLSPLSVMIALSMTGNGAVSNSLAEMEGLFGDISIDDLNEYLYTYVNSLPSEQKAKLAIANSIWFDKERITVYDDFLETNAQYYDAGVFSADFGKEATVQDINNWIKANTMDMIDEVIKEIDGDTVMFLINAVAFDAEWEKPFGYQLTHEADFKKLDGSTVKVEMMSSDTEDDYYIATDDAVGFRKDYSGGEYSFIALLPNEDVDFYDYINSFTGEKFISAAESATKTRVAIGLPKFSYAYDVNLVDPLKSLGMVSPFGGGLNDIGESPLGDLYISDVVHNTFIQVDELGTKAGAVTVVTINAESMPPTVVLNRPFVYAIVDNSTNIPVFVGTVIDFE